MIITPLNIIIIITSLVLGFTIAILLEHFVWPSFNARFNIKSEDDEDDENDDKKEDVIQ